MNDLVSTLDRLKSLVPSDDRVRYSAEAGLILFALINPLSVSVMRGALGDRPWIIALVTAVLYFAIVYWRMVRAGAPVNSQ